MPSPLPDGLETRRKKGPYKCTQSHSKYGRSDPKPEPVKPASARGLERAREAQAADHRHVNQGHPATSERFYQDDETEFIMAMDEFKLRTGHKFPRWSEVLGVLKSLGYSK